MDFDLAFSSYLQTSTGAESRLVSEPSGWGRSLESVRSGPGQPVKSKVGGAGLLEFQSLFALDGTLRVEELIGYVGQDGGTARGDTALGHQDEEAGEKLVDGEGSFKLREFGEEVGGEVFRVTG